MSINCLSSAQCIINKRKAAAGAAGVVIINSLNASSVFSPFYYWNPTSTILSANSVII